MEKIYLAYGEHLSPSIDCSVEPSVTKQSFAAECDINTIMSRYERTGVIDFVNAREGRYGDASAIDYQKALNIVIEADEMFADMPASLRSRFDNDPVKFLDFVDDPANLDEGIKLGLFKAPAPSEGGSPSAMAAGAGGAVSAPPIGGNAEG